MKTLAIVACAGYLAASCRASGPLESIVKEDGGERSIVKVTCVASGERTLVIERSLEELPFPAYHVKFENRGRIVVQVNNAPLVRNTDTSFMVQKVTDIDHRQGIQISAGVHWVGGSARGFYQEAANGGLSPLPGIEFGTCQIEVISRG